MPQDPVPPTSGSSLRFRRGAARGRTVLIVLAAIVAVLILWWIFTGFYTTLLWFRSVDFSSVYTTELRTRIALFVVFGLLMAAAVVANCWIAYRTRPPFRGLSSEQQSLDRYRVALDPFRRLAVAAVAILLALIAGSSASSDWQLWLAFINSEPFRASDAQFHLDISFYVFRLPFWQFLVGFGFALVVVSLLVALVTHYLYGGLRIQTPGEKTTGAARAHIAVLLGLFVLLKAAAYWFDRYGLVIKDNQPITGATYTDVNALLPAKQILFVIALICAVLFFATVFTRNWLAPAIGFGLLVVSAIVIGGIYPAFVQSVQVNPSVADKEAPYIQRNINATIQAYGLGSVQLTQYAAATDPRNGLSTSDAATVANIRVIDPNIVSKTFKALQQNRGFYNFPDVLDIDRYQLPSPTGKGPSAVYDSVVAARELDLNGLPTDQQNFINIHTVFTHGYGFVGSYGNSATSDGSPLFFESNIPPVGPLTITQPRIYFGENSPDYSIVGAPKGAAPVEFDFPSNTGSSGGSNNTYDGTGGVPMGSFFGRLLFATKFSEPNLLLSDRVNSASRILWNRSPLDRVQAVAPWLNLDGDTYPAVIDGRIKFIVDGYTTTDDYPYSQRTNLTDATSNSVTAQNSSVVPASGEVNYMRNSVKAVVDAYDGTVSLYAWTPNGEPLDPILKVWMNAFPGTVQSYSSIPPSLMEHFRYPQDLFEVQRQVYAKYHIGSGNPRQFYSGQFFWEVPSDPTEANSGGTDAQPPYYLTLQMPDQTSAAFSLTTTFAPVNRGNLAAFMAVDSRPGPDYGIIRVLQLPGNETIPGPAQVQNKFEADPTISAELSLLRRGGSNTQFGALLSLPVGKGFLYVEPVYIIATGAGNTNYPLLGRVLASFGNTVAMGNNLADALNLVFQGNTAGVTVPGTGTGNTVTPPPTGGAATGASAALKVALAQAQQAIADAQAAFKRGDFAAYGQAQARLAAAIQAAVAAEAKLGKVPGVSASTSPSPSSSASSSP